MHNIGDLVMTILLDGEPILGVISDYDGEAEEYIINWIVDDVEVLFRHDEEQVTKLKEILSDRMVK